MNKPPFWVTSWHADFENRNLDRAVYYSDPLQKVLTVAFEFYSAAELEHFRNTIQETQTFKWDLPVPSLSNGCGSTTFEGTIKKVSIKHTYKNLVAGEVTCIVD